MKTKQWLLAFKRLKPYISNMREQNWAIIEFGNSHLECIHTVVYQISKNHRPPLILVADGLHQRMHGLDYYKNIEVTPLSSLSFEQIYAKLERFKISHLYFNTCSGKKVLKFLYHRQNRGYANFGTIHEIKKLRESWAQCLINKKVDQYFVLSGHLVPRKPRDVRVMEPIFFPFKDLPPPEHLDFKNKKLVVIPGQVETKRRAYGFLLQQLKQNRQNLIDFKFVFLGPAFHPHGDGAFIKQQILEAGLDQWIHLYDGDQVISDKLFHQVIQHSHAILPLINPDQTQHHPYLSQQYSGSFALGYTYCKPFVLHKKFEAYKEFSEHSFFYDENNFVDALISSTQTGQYQAKVERLKNFKQEKLALNPFSESDI